MDTNFLKHTKRKGLKSCTKQHTGHNRYIAIPLVVLLMATLFSGCAQSAGSSVVDTAGKPKGEGSSIAELKAGESTAIVSEATDPTSVEIDSGKPTAGTETTVINVTDMMGRQITLDKPAERIVALAASDCEILYAIGAGETLVGRGEYCDYPAEVLNVPSVQSGSETNVEQIIALEPQVVIMSIMAQSKDQVGILEDAGIKVVAVNAQDIEGVYTAIGLMGTITGKDLGAAGLVNDMKAAFAELSGKIVGDGTATIYFEVSPLEYGLWTAGSGTFMNELAVMLGLTNAFADVQGWGEISQEQVIERNPDYIVTIAMYFGEGLKPVDEIMGREGWQKMKAISGNRVYNVNSDEISRPGPRLADALATMYNFIYVDKAAEPAA